MNLILIQYTILEFQFRCIKCKAVTRLRKNFEQLFTYKVITVCWCKEPTSKGFQTCLYCIYLSKSYDESIIILPGNSLTKIWSKISKIRLILRMIYTCNVKGLEEVKKLPRNKCTLHWWSRLLEMSDFRPYQ